MEKIFQQKKFTAEQGENSSKIFSAEINKTETTKEIYGQSAEYFADIIRQKLSPDKEYNLADLGCFSGELLKNVLKFLPEYKFHTYGVDRVQNLKNNSSAQEKIIADLEHIPLADKSIDVALGRYILVWNDAEKQKNILKEIARIIRGFAIVQSAGSDTDEPDAWRDKIDNLFSGKDITKLQRIGHYFSSRDEIEKWMKKENIRFKRIQDRKVDDFSNVFCEKYNLNNEECIKTKEILKDKDFAIQNSWIIYPIES